MGKSSNGIKAGAVAGIVYGIIAAIVMIVSLIVFKTEVLNALAQYMSTHSIYAANGYTNQKLYNQYMISGPVVEVIAGIIVGLIFGLIFAHVQKHLPGSNMPVKGLIFGLILWVIIGVLIHIGNIGQYGVYYFALTVGGSLIAALAYGYLLGKLYSSWQEGGETVTEPSKA